MGTATTENRWATASKYALKGATIVDVRYLTEEEQETMDWDRKAIVLVLDNGVSIWPSSDDEGNAAGAMFTTLESLPTIPVI